MYLFSLVIAALISLRPALAQNGEDHITVTSAFAACATGEAASKYSSCSLSISSRIDKCKDDDFGCACQLATSGFECLKAHCHSATKAVCAASYMLNGLCNAVSQPGPTFTDYSCPTSIDDSFASLLPTNINYFISSAMATHIPSNTLLSNGLERQGSQSMEGNGETSEGGSRNDTIHGHHRTTTKSITVPSATGAARGRFGGLASLKIMKGHERDPMSWFLGSGAFVAVIAAGLAVFL